MFLEDSQTWNCFGISEARKRGRRSTAARKVRTARRANGRQVAGRVTDYRSAFGLALRLAGGEKKVRLGLEGLPLHSDCSALPLLFLVSLFLVFLSSCLLVFLPCLLVLSSNLLAASRYLPTALRSPAMSQCLPTAHCPPAVPQRFPLPPRPLTLSLAPRRAAALSHCRLSLRRAAVPLRYLRPRPAQLDSPMLSLGPHPCTVTLRRD